jgi:hypothetical protein
MASLVVAADNAELEGAEVLQAAQSAFEAGMSVRDSAAKARPHFARAAELYEELRHRGANNPELHRNLGHAYLLAGDLPMAILTYRRGLQQVPRDRGLEDDLATTRALVVYAGAGNFGRPPRDDWPPWLPHLSCLAWFGIATLFYVLAWPCGVRWWLTRRGHLLAMGIVTVLIACTASVIAWAEAQRQQDDAEHPVVVMAADGVRLRRGDGPNFPPRYEVPLNRGVEARLLYRRNDWLQIELSGGEVGWVSLSSAVIDWTTS